jgi:iron complex transport system substrate-binding protein
MMRALAACLLAFGIVGAADAARALSAAASTPATLVTLRDDLQRDVTLSRYPHRIVTLLPSLTETVCALGACDRVVATDRYSDWPVEVRALPKTGGLDDVEIEAIVRLNPDLVLLSRSQRITERLGELGVTSFALDTENYAAMDRVVTLIGALLGLSERAALLNRQIDDAVRQVSEQMRGRRRGSGPSVYFEVDRAPYAAGPRSFIGELLSRLGARNIVTADLGPFPKLNPEYVVRHDPDVIFVAPADAPHLVERPGWDQIRAVKENRICSFAPTVEDTVVRPGPRVAEGMRAIAACLDRFAP